MVDSGGRPPPGQQPDLATLLRDVGAASLDPTLSLPPSGQVPRYKALHDRIQLEIQSVNDQTRDLLKRSWPDFAHQVQTGEQLLEDIEHEETELQSLEQLTTGEHALLPPLLSLLSTHSALSHSHSHSSHAVNLLTALLTLHSAISQLASFTSAGKLSDSVRASKAVQALLAQGPEQWIQGNQLWSFLVKWAHEETARVESALTGAFESCFELEGNSLTLRRSVTVVPDGPALEVADVLGALEGRVESLLAKTAKGVLKTFVVPWIESLRDGSPAVFSYTRNVDGRSCTISLQSSLDGNYSDRDTSFTPLQIFLHALGTESTLLPTSPYASLFTLHLTPSIQQSLVTSYLVPLLPPSINELPPYLNLVASAVALEKSFLPSEGFFAFLPPGQDEARSVIQSWASSVDKHWAKKVRDDALERVRREILKPGWDETEVVDKLIEIEAPPKPPTPPPAPPEPQKVEKAPTPPPVTRAPEPQREATPPPAQQQQLKRGKLGTRITPAPPSPVRPVATTTPPTPSLPRIASPTPPSRPQSMVLSSSSASSLASSTMPTSTSASVPGRMTSPPDRVTSPPGRVTSPLERMISPPPPSGFISPSLLLNPEEVEEEGDEWGLGTDEESAIGNTSALGEDDDWGLGTRRSSTKDNGLHPSSASSSAGGSRARALSITSIGSGGSADAWGFGDVDLLPLDSPHKEADKEAELRRLEDLEEGNSSAVADVIAQERAQEREDDEARLLEDLEEGNSGVQGDSVFGDGDDDGWGFGDDDEESGVGVSASLPASPVAQGIVQPSGGAEPAAISLAPAMVPVASQGEHSANGDWGWEDPEEEVGKAKSESPSKKLNGFKIAAKPSEEEVEASRWRKERMTISQRSRVVIKVAEEMLAEALEVSKAGFRFPAFAPASKPLLQAFSSILSLYRAVVPVYHSKLLLSVPAIGMQFANDCEWIADEVVKLAGGQAKSEGSDSVVKIASKMMNKLGGDWRAKLIAEQKAALNDILDEANRFLYTGEDSRFATCERALKQVVYTLERLAQVWKPVMNATLYYSVLGELVNDVLTRVLTEIEDQADISEEESIRLNKLCKELHALEALFAGGTTSVGREVPVWFKFVFLSELLEASMADILFLFNNGHLVDFSTQEISKLVRALFADSPMRQKNLAHIALGHPDRVPDDSSDEDDGD